MGTKAPHKCFICGKKITDEDIKEGIAETSVSPGNKHIYVCTAHHGVESV